MESTREPELNVVPAEKPIGIRELHITYNPNTSLVEVKGHVMDKFTCLQMLAEAGHIIIGLKIPVDGPSGNKH